MTIWSYERISIIGTFGVPGENDNARRVEFCVDDTYFKHRSSYMYTTVEKRQDRVKVKSMIDLVLVVKSDIVRYVQDVRAVRRMG